MLAVFLSALDQVGALFASSPYPLNLAADYRRDCSAYYH
jgi:hypothetical protein